MFPFQSIVNRILRSIFREPWEGKLSSKFKNWLYRIATGTCLKQKRKCKYAPEGELSLDEFIRNDASDGGLNPCPPPAD
jgi:DNA-directed RNA polymerase specialized sigma24 family protein